MKTVIGRAIYVLVAVGLVANAYFLLYAGEPGKLRWWPMAFGFYAWSAVPFVAIAAIKGFLVKGVWGVIALSVTALVVACGGIFLLIQAFFTHPDAQSGILFIFLPAYQCSVVAIGLIFVMVSSHLETRKR